MAIEDAVVLAQCLCVGSHLSPFIHDPAFLNRFLRTGFSR